MSKFSPVDLAIMIQEAQRLQEESWDGTEYKLNENQAAEKACIAHPEMAEVVYFLNKYVWDDIQDWANERVKIG